MAGKDRRQAGPQWRWNNLLENLFIVILAFYPLRHIGWGLDLWDTGYNYANFQYMSTEHMDPMWLFSTYLANVFGKLLTGLPNADTLRGMNLYTGLVVSALALTGYFFCTRRLGIPRVIAFAGEMAAISLCWCPTAILYNYLTYVFYLGSFLLLYKGLTEEKKGCLMGAGVLLGTNVLVRFSNLPEAAMILAVWAYDLILWLEERREGRKPAGEGEGFWSRLLRHTLWCLLGYVGALAVLLLHIHIRYGIDEYVTGIMRLFSMTDRANDYKPAAMILNIVQQYLENMYWVVRMGMILLGGMVLFAGSLCLEERFSGKEGKQGAKILHIGVRILWGAVSIAMIVWLYYREFCSFLFYSYDPIWRPGILFLMLTMLIAAVRILHKSSPKEEKLISIMVILVILLTPIGSNNGMLPSLNNLFIAAPYTLWQSWRFLRTVGERKTRGGIWLSGFPAKGILTAFLALCLFQFGAFGAQFAFAEATGIQNATASVDNNAVLKNISMSPEKAQWMTEISAFVNENSMQGREVILYGWIPALAYYLQMPPAFNSWSDLDSYGPEVMEEELAILEEEVLREEGEKPVIILEERYALYEEGGEKALTAAGFSETEGQKLTSDIKWTMLLEFMDHLDYRQSFRNGKFAVYQSSYGDEKNKSPQL